MSKILADHMANGSNGSNGSKRPNGSKGINGSDELSGSNVCTPPSGARCTIVRFLGTSQVYPTPYTLHPTPNTLHPTP